MHRNGECTGQIWAPGCLRGHPGQGPQDTPCQPCPSNCALQPPRPGAPGDSVSPTFNEVLLSPAVRTSHPSPCQGGTGRGVLLLMLA